MKKGLILIIVLIVAAMAIIYFVKDGSSKSTSITNNMTATVSDTLDENIPETNTMSEEQTQNQKVVLKTNTGDITLEIYNSLVPETAENFVRLAQNGFYNGTRFHRVIKGFMIQAGDPLSADIEKKDIWGTGGPEYVFDDEFGEGLSNVTGTISMANRGPNTNGSQFFINVADNFGLDYDKEPLMSKHSVFGKVIEGMDIVIAISESETDPWDRPVEDVVIESVIVE